MPLWLIGMMGSGKTTVAVAVAARTGGVVLDTDRMIEEEAGSSVSEIFASEGEEQFRAREHAAVTRAAQSNSAIVATGGGVVLDIGNIETMRDSGPVIWLQAEPATLAGRLAGATDRPLLGEEPLAILTSLLVRRSPAYEAAADHIIDTDGIGASRVAVLVEEIWNGY